MCIKEVFSVTSEQLVGCLQIPAWNQVRIWSVYGIRVGFIRGIYYIQLWNLEVTLGLLGVRVLGRTGTGSRLSSLHKRGCGRRLYAPVVLGTHLAVCFTQTGNHFCVPQNVAYPQPLLSFSELGVSTNDVWLRAGVGFLAAAGLLHHQVDSGVHPAVRRSLKLTTHLHAM
jgi:hypothetical protein